MIVFTIYKNGANADVLGASFSCAVFGVRCGSGVNAGAAGDGGHSRLRFDCQLRFAVARSVRSRTWSVVLSGARYVSPALGRAVLNDDAGAFVRSGGQSVSRAVLIEYFRAARGRRR